jgi:hypothetical protein
MFVASAHRAGLGSAPGSTAWKIGASGECADAAAAPPTPIYPLRSLTPRTGRRPPARPMTRRPVCEATTVWLGAERLIK